MAHSGGQHKRAPGILGRAHRFVTGCGFNVAAIDAPGHGDRPRTAEDEQKSPSYGRLRRRASRSARSPPGSTSTWRRVPCRNGRRPWTPSRELPEIGAEGPIGFWGIMQGTGIGVPLTAVEPRITAAVFGCLGHESVTEAAAQITVPIEFLLQWDDEHVDRQSGLALFDAFASKEKTLHANAGAHGDVPRFEADSATRFFARHLGRAVTSPA